MFTVHRSLFTVRSPFTVYHERVMVIGECMDNGQWKTDNGFSGDKA